MRFQSFFMLMTTQPCFLASSYRACVKVPTFGVRQLTRQQSPAAKARSRKRQFHICPHPVRLPCRDPKSAGGGRGVEAALLSILRKVIVWLHWMYQMVIN